MGMNYTVFFGLYSKHTSYARVLKIKLTISDVPPKSTLEAPRSAVRLMAMGEDAVRCKSHGCHGAHLGPPRWALFPVSTLSSFALSLFHYYPQYVHLSLAFSLSRFHSVVSTLDS